MWCLLKLSFFSLCFYCVFHPHKTIYFDTMRLRQHERYFADDRFQCKLLNENICCSNSMSSKYVFMRLLDDKLELVPVMAWQCTGNKSLPKSITIQFLANQWVIRLLTSQEPSKLNLTSYLWGWPVDFPHKGTVMQTDLPCHDVIMNVDRGCYWCNDI